MPRYLHTLFLALLLILNLTPASANAPQDLSMSEQKVDYQADFSGRPFAATDAEHQYFGNNERD